ncbi:copper homeostasis protein [Marinactinospora thermotolerans DSM 45154]|uniref:PF03932 family protein CutC n=1 Tax=Marinactinospora thermotolerans DSM 45154 TaxID=1122192 RepID=A0A1T4LQG9_9ACTN|nr:copper homeostasis protein CutC [Marinactinospora thermotolerans]SJZ56887.1 copper homeostasis protein [Marinactinospora thermotolerans DSM 45154]
MTLRFEICVDGVEGALIAERAGADRVELCSALSEGGLTPSLGTVEETLAATSRIRVHPIVRPRGGDFVYDRHEVAAMERDVWAFATAGVPGVVIGALTPEGKVDRPAVERLVAAAQGLSVTFHRAFDMAADPFSTLEELIDLGVQRVLTSGQEATAPAGAPLISELVRHAGGRISIMPGGGVDERTAADLVARTGVDELHFSGMETVPVPVAHRNPRVRMATAAPVDETERRVSSPRRIAAIMAAAREQA